MIRLTKLAEIFQPFGAEGQAATVGTATVFPDPFAATLPARGPFGATVAAAVDPFAVVAGPAPDPFATTVALRTS